MLHVAIHPSLLRKPQLHAVRLAVRAFSSSASPGKKQEEALPPSHPGAQAPPHGSKTTVKSKSSDHPIVLKSKSHELDNKFEAISSGVLDAVIKDSKDAEKRAASATASSTIPKKDAKSGADELVDGGRLTVGPPSSNASKAKVDSSHGSETASLSGVTKDKEKDEDSDSDDDDDDDSDDEDDEETHARKAAERQQAHDKAILATKLGAGVNVLLSIMKGTTGLAISSTALIADAVSGLGDVFGDAVVYFTVNEARKRATPDRPWGRGKIEPLGALTVGSLLMVTGAGIGYSASMVALDTLQCAVPAVATAIDATGIAVPPSIIPRAPDDFTPSINHYAALTVSGMSIVSKELLFRYTLAAGKQANSSAVIANAWQHRADVSTSLAVFAGLIGSMCGYPILDPVAGMVVACLITRQAYKIVIDALRDLSDAPAGEKETQSLRATCLEIKGVLGVKELRARKSGPFLFVEVTVNVDGTISASAAHRLAELTRLELLKDHAGRVANAVVHVNPLGSAGLGEHHPSWSRDHDDIIQEIKKAVRPIPEIHSVSEVQVYYRDNGTIAAKVDIVLQGNLTILQAHAIATRAREQIETCLPGIGDIDVDLELDETTVLKR